MKYLGVDFGTKKVGLALSNEEGTIAFPRAIVPNDAELIAHIVRLAGEEKVAGIVVGDTRALSGAANQASGEAETFIEKLAAVAPVPVKRGMEAWSSVEASRFAPRGHARDDSAAAAIILQRFLDFRAKK